MPGRQVVSGLRTGPGQSYVSSFSKWESRASVRTKRRRRLEAGESDLLYFPPELVPITGSTLIRCLPPGAVEEILIQRLYQYMQFTVELEQTVVIPVATMLSRGISGFDLPVVMRADAFKIVTDEAWHAQCAFDMLSQIREATQVEPHLPARPQFISRLADLAVHLDSETHTCRDILFCIISETLISSILSDIPQDTRLHGAVRAVIADHAEDEGKHHAYFHALLEYFWPSLTVDQQRELGRQIPMLIRIFLEPDYGALSGALSAI